MEASTRFYSIVPTTSPGKISDETNLNLKMQMMECLLQLQEASDLMKSAEGGVPRHPTDKNYDALKAQMTSLAHWSDEFIMMEEYVRNTHAATHSSYSLTVLDCFRVERHGNADRFRAFATHPNRQLLWHGSRLTNWIGILSQGLRIAPPEAPVTGYMFGKGVYFADMVSKSANYCFASRSSPVGVLLLCEVALGNMYELTGAMYMDQPPAGFQSTKGCGVTYPNPTGTVELPGVPGCVVPKGRPVTAARTGSLLYNEFIVYNVAQIRARYLLKVRFNY